MAKLTSSTDKTTAQVSPDGHSIIFKSIETGHQVFWPMKDWKDLKDHVDKKAENNG